MLGLASLSEESVGLDLQPRRTVRRPPEERRPTNVEVVEAGLSQQHCKISVVLPRMYVMEVGRRGE